jgi:hypothetical protein
MSEPHLIPDGDPVYDDDLIPTRPMTTAELAAPPDPRFEQKRAAIDDLA